MLLRNEDKPACENSSGPNGKSTKVSCRLKAEYPLLYFPKDMYLSFPQSSIFDLQVEGEPDEVAFFFSFWVIKEKQKERVGERLNSAELSV